MKFTPRIRFRDALITLALGMSAAFAVAQGGAQSASQSMFSGKTIRMVVPYPAGGSADAVLRAEPDGTTLLITVTSQLTNSVVGVKPNYNATEDFAPIAGLTLAPMALAVTAGLPVNSVKELEAYAKTKPLSYGSYGVGSSGHVMLGLFSRSIGANMVHVPYRGESPMVSDMLGGQVQLALLTVGIARELQNSGKVKLLGAVGPQRSEFLPKVPTMREQGYSGFDWSYGIALYASSKVPAAVQQKLAAASREVISTEAVRQQLRKLGAEPWGASPSELKTRLVVDTVLWNKTLETFGKGE